MSAPRKPRHSRKSDVPHEYIRNWQFSRGRGAKPLVRRPPTACEACRAAKVKCNGAQPVCGRCTDRGIMDCRYTAPSSSDKSEPSAAAPPSPLPVRVPTQVSPSTQVQTSTEQWPPLSQAVPKEIMDLDMGSADQLYLDFAEYEQASETWSDWTNGVVGLPGPGQLDWLSTSMSTVNVSTFLGLSAHAHELMTHLSSP